jgi:hypothetical protein
VCAPIRTFSITLRLPNYATKLERTGDTAARQFLGRKAGDRCPIETDLAAVGPVEPGNEIEQGGLAGAVRADDADQFAFGEVEIDVRRPR